MLQNCEKKLSSKLLISVSKGLWPIIFNTCVFSIVCVCEPWMDVVQVEHFSEGFKPKNTKFRTYLLLTFTKPELEPEIWLEVKKFEVLVYSTEL